MNSRPETVAETARLPEPPAAPGTASGCARDRLDLRFVYTVLSPRARGLSVGVNMNPDGRCNFDCAYCEVNRSALTPEPPLDVPAMTAELAAALELVFTGRLRERPCYRNLPDELLRLRQVALSGDGEPTLCPDFVAAVESVLHLRSAGRFPWFKLVLITNASRLDRPEVAEGLSHFSTRDEIWAKLEAGTTAYWKRVNRPDCTLDRIVANILLVARRRPVIIQSLFPAIGGEAPPPAEIDAYLRRLLALREGGAQIPLVQIYSATRPSVNSDCGHLPLRILSHIARRVRETTGLAAEVF